MSAFCYKLISFVQQHSFGEQNLVLLCQAYKQFFESGEYGLALSSNSPLIRQKCEFQNGGNKQTKHAKVSKFLNFPCFVFLMPPFWDLLFCLITEELLDFNTIILQRKNAWFNLPYSSNGDNKLVKLLHLVDTYFPNSHKFLKLTQQQKS